MRRWLLLLLILSIAFAPHLAVAELTKEDFAYGVSIDVPKGSPVAALSVPLPVYRDVVRDDLGDMRVFNAAGEPVPHMIRYAQSRQSDAPWRNLIYFPLASVDPAEAGGYKVYVNTNPHGAIVRVDPMIAPLPSEVVRTWLVDLSRLRRSLAQLRLTWQPPQKNMMVTVKVEASDDLSAWTTIQPRSTLSDVRYAGRRLLRNTIDLRASSQRYLRLQLLENGPSVALTRIEGRIQPQGRQAVRAVARIQGRAVGGMPGIFAYRSTGALPVDRINLVFDTPNSMADALVESRSDDQATWTRRAQAMFYRIDMGATMLTSNPVSVPMTSDRFWQVSVDASESTLGSVVPVLEIGYRAHDLFFIARGNGPFTLAFGSSQVQPLKVNVAALFDGIGEQQADNLEHWVAETGPRTILGGPERLKPAPKELPTRRIILWSVLLVGVLVVAAMAMRLAKRMM